MDCKHTYEITPGSMGVVSQAVKLFGADNVKPGGWGSPVWVQCTDEFCAKSRRTSEIVDSYYQEPSDVNPQ